MTIHSERPLVTIKDAMLYLHVSRRTIYNWLHDNKVEYVRIPGGAIRIYADSLTQPFTDMRQKPKPKSREIHE
jgi:excisionase family DNA binding protein